jgi:hypothetical protein
VLKLRSSNYKLFASSGARMRKQAIIARLEKWAGEGVDEEDELKEFLR